MVNYGIAHQIGWIDNKVNLSDAMKYFKIAADENNVSTCFNYAITFEDGYGGQINLSEAMKYYKFAAGFNRSRSIVSYGHTLSSGYSVRQIQNCSKIFQKVADFQDSEGIF
jgi:TPR repeat protein